ncbi:MAG: FAD-dependent oxidoreductase [bacterium]|nr:FAD-dependent oxidoreductase [bacterium]
MINNYNNIMRIDSDFLIVGAGIIGIFTAYNLMIHRFPNRKIIVLEKEKDVCFPANGRNSGVLHAGIYYSPDSMKAKFSREGNSFLTQYCLSNNIDINWDLMTTLLLKRELKNYI